MLSFFPARNYAVGREPRWLATADFNYDGIPDLATANGFNPGTVSVLLGVGDGTFLPQRTSAIDGSLRGITVADFNQDGFADIAVARNNGTRIFVLLGNGNGFFQPAVGYYSGPAGPQWVEAADFNGDGYPDLVTASGTNLNYFSILENRGDGTFWAPQLFFLEGAFWGIARDLDGDFDIDLAVTCALGNPTPCSRLSILHNVSEGRINFRLAQTIPLPIAVTTLDMADFNQDGYQDLVVGRGSANLVNLLRGLGEIPGTFLVELSPIEVINSPTGIAAADFDFNGFPDFVVTRSSGNNVGVFIHRCEYNFEFFVPPLNYNVGIVPVGVVTADFNLDGYPDVAVGHSTSSFVSVLINDGNWSDVCGGAPAPGEITPISWDSNLLVHGNAGPASRVELQIVMEQPRGYPTDRRAIIWCGLSDHDDPDPESSRNRFLVERSVPQASLAFQMIDEPSNWAWNDVATLTLAGISP